ncbi:MAG: 4-hydroxybenzoate octaprenyltransferase, partial [Verrucomicrobia bacterium]|nr:4-hydroxybenzoate octaprenyltransferase [Verrucomicrobiota bacterium]
LVACWGEKNAVSYAFLVHLIMLMGMAVFGFLVFFKLAYMIGIVFIALVVLMEHGIGRIRKKHWLGNAFFRLNMVVSLVYLTAVGCEVVLSFFDNFYRQ